MVSRYCPHFDSLHPDHTAPETGNVRALTIAELADLRRRVVPSDRSAWDWTSDGSEQDPYWLYRGAARQRARVRGLLAPEAV